MNICCLPVEAIYVPVERRVQEDLGILLLAASIVRHGLLQPIVVRGDGNRFVLVCGARRLAACRAAGIARVYAVVLSCSAAEAAACFLEEQMLRGTPEPLRMAAAINKAHAAQVKASCVLPKGCVEAYGTLHALPARVRAEIERQHLTLEQALPLSDMEEEMEAVEAALLIGGRGLSGEQAYRLVRAFKSCEKKRPVNALMAGNRGKSAN